MGLFSVTVDASGLRKLERSLEAMRAKLPLAIARGLNEGGDRVRTQCYRAMRGQTSLTHLYSVTQRSSTIRAFPGAPRSGIGPVGPGKLSYTIVFRGKPPTKPPEFKTRVIKGRGGGVVIRMWGVDHKFARSFQQKNLGGLRARIGGPRKPIRGFDGPNLAKEAVKGQVAEAFVRGSETLVLPIVEKQIVKVLGL